MIGAKYKLKVNQIVDVLGWTVPGQLKGYVSGAGRRSFRLINSLGSKIIVSRRDAKMRSIMRDLDGRLL
jgi:hypothetical protein